jgi:hypothetical protein
MNARRCFSAALAASADPFRLQTVRFFSTLFLFAIGASATASALALELRFRHAGHLTRNAIGFPLILVSRLVDQQFRLNDSSGGWMQGNPVEIVSDAARGLAG